MQGCDITYITFYKQEWLHQALDYRTPAQVYGKRGTEAHASGGPAMTCPQCAVPKGRLRAHEERDRSGL